MFKWVENIMRQINEIKNPLRAVKYKGTDLGVPEPQNSGD